MVVLLPLSITVLASLVVTIGMMFTLGRGLSVIKDPAEPYVAAIGRTLFPSSSSISAGTSTPMTCARYCGPMPSGSPTPGTA